MLVEAKIKERESQQKMMLEQQKHQAEMEKMRVDMRQAAEGDRGQGRRPADQARGHGAEAAGAEEDFDLKSRSAEQRLRP